MLNAYSLHAAEPQRLARKTRFSSNDLRCCFIITPASAPAAPPPPPGVQHSPVQFSPKLPTPFGALVEIPLNRITKALVYMFCLFVLSFSQGVFNYLFRAN